MNKKILSVVSLVLVFLMLVACGGGEKAPESTAPESSAPESTAPESTAPESEAPTTDWPTKPITVIVPAGAGGDTDLNTRVFCKFLQEELGQTVVVSNIKGMAVAFDEIAKAANDGYTVGSYHPGMFVANTLGTTDKKWDESYEFCNVFANDKQTAWLVSSKSDIKTLDDLIAKSKEQPIGFATEVGSVSHLTQLMFMQLVEGSQFNIVDAGGSADKITALLSGQLDLMYNQMGLVKDYLTNGDFVALGVMAEERSENWPDVPTFKEQGVDMVFDKPYWIFFPKDTDQAIVDKMNEAIAAVCANPDYAAELSETMQTVPGDMTPDEAVTYLKDIEATYVDLLSALK
ncbi:MAG: tripartite tricarboxylate transporter substrate binding protein [Candidatus Heteroscillospira sp.]|jgi:tripartite-type tricarboxylate transporter receptor subunit TctC